MNKTVKKIALESMFASNKEALINRLAFILEDSEIDAAVEGIPMNVVLKDNALRFITDDVANKNIDIFNVEVKYIGISEIGIKYFYKRTYWFKTEEDAAAYDGTDASLRGIQYSSSESETYKFARPAGTDYGSRCYSIERASEFCDIELLQYKE